MLFNAFVGIIATQFASGVVSSQIPTVHGVVGGVPSSPVASTRTPGKLRVTENSGICETTQGVYQASGYGDLTASESMWYVTSHVHTSDLRLMYA